MDGTPSSPCSVVISLWRRFFLPQGAGAPLSRPDLPRPVQVDPLVEIYRAVLCGMSIRDETKNRLALGVYSAVIVYRLFCAASHNDPAITCV